MRIKLLSCVSDSTNPNVPKLEASLQRFEYDYKIIVNPSVIWGWAGLKDIYEWCLSEEAECYTHFLYTDGFDTIALAPMSEVYKAYTDSDVILYSAEKACFPRQDWAQFHPTLNKKYRWQYLNSGQFLAPVKQWALLFEEMFDFNVTCQDAAMQKQLFDNDAWNIQLDLECKIFQSIAFIAGDEFSIEGERLINNLTGSRPVFPHANGRSQFDWVTNIIGL